MTPDTPVTYWQLDLSRDTELANLTADLAASRKRLDAALFKHLAMLAPVAVGGMGMFLGDGPGKLAPAQVAMVAVPAAVLVFSVFLSALSLAIAPSNVITINDRAGNPIRQPRDAWIAELNRATIRTNWHRAFEDNVQFVGFAAASLCFILAGMWSLLGLTGALR